MQRKVLASSHQHLMAEAPVFDSLVHNRNALIHAHPITDEGGAQILSYQGSPSRQISDMRWEIASIEEFVREVDASACEASNIFEQLEQK